MNACYFNPRPAVHDLRHTRKTNAMRSRVHQGVADIIIGHGNRKKDIRSLYLMIRDANLLEAIDAMEFEHGETAIWLIERKNAKLPDERNPMGTIHGPGCSICVRA